MGMTQNDTEVQRYGTWSPEALAEFRERSFTPNIELISNPKYKK